MGRAPEGQCGHDDCSFNGRLEYCALTAADPTGLVQLVTEQLDDLVYQADTAISEEFELTADNEAQIATRSFSWWHHDGHVVLPLTETHVAIQHTYNKLLKRDTYAVVIGWNILREELDGSPFVTTYGIDIYQQGPVQAIVQEMTVAENGALDTRRMTNYDFIVLFDELDRLTELQTIEARTKQVKG